MNCDEARQSIEYDYLAKGGGRYSLTVDQHLLSCAACREHRANLSKMLQSFQLLKTTTPKEQIINNLAMDLIIQGRQEKDRKKKLTIIVPSALAGVLVTAFFIYFFSSSNQQEEAKNVMKPPSTKPFSQTLKNPAQKKTRALQDGESQIIIEPKAADESTDGFASPFAKIDENLKKKLNPKVPRASNHSKSGFADKEPKNEAPGSFISALPEAPKTNAKKYTITENKPHDKEQDQGQEHHTNPPDALEPSNHISSKHPARIASAGLNKNQNSHENAPSNRQEMAEEKTDKEKKDGNNLKKLSPKKNEPTGLLARAKKMIGDYLKNPVSGSKPSSATPPSFSSPTATAPLPIEPDIVCRSETENLQQAAYQIYEQHFPVLTTLSENPMGENSIDFLTYLTLTRQTLPYLNGPVLSVENLPALERQYLSLTIPPFIRIPKLDLQNTEDDWNWDQEAEEKTAVNPPTENATGNGASTLSFYHAPKDSDSAALNTSNAWLVQDPQADPTTAPKFLSETPLTADTVLMPLAKPRPYLEWGTCQVPSPAP